VPLVNDIAITRAAKIYKSFSCSRRKKLHLRLKGKTIIPRASEERAPPGKGSVIIDLVTGGATLAGLLLYRPYRTSLGSSLVHGRTMHITGGGERVQCVAERESAVQCMCQAGGGRKTLRRPDSRTVFVECVPFSGISVKGLSVWKQNAGRTWFKRKSTSKSGQMHRKAGSQQVMLVEPDGTSEIVSIVTSRYAAKDHFTVVNKL